MVFEHHRLTWGGGYRLLHHETRGSTSFNRSPGERHDHQFTAFLQDEIALPPENPDMPLPTLWRIGGNRDIKPEELIAYEVGWRAELHERPSADLALFYNNYDRLRAYEDLTPIWRDGIRSHMELPVVQSNTLKGQTYGAEFSTLWQAAAFLRLRLGYSYLALNLKAEHGKAVYPAFI